MKSQKYTSDFIDRIKNYYINNTLSLEEISENSRELFGQPITLNDIKYYSRKEKWSIIKANSGRNTNEVPMTEKLTKIADKLYEVMIDEEEPVPASSLAQLARTWSELLIKANLNKDSSTNKVSAQTVKDIFAQFEAEENQKEEDGVHKPKRRTNKRTR